jgi:hypothetical protein
MLKLDRLVGSSRTVTRDFSTAFETIFPPFSPLSAIGLLTNLDFDFQSWVSDGSRQLSFVGRLGYLSFVTRVRA